MQQEERGRGRFMTSWGHQLCRQELRNVPNDGKQNQWQRGRDKSVPTPVKHITIA